MTAKRLHLALVLLFIAIVGGCGAAKSPEPAKLGMTHGSLPKAAIRKVVHSQIAMIEQCTNTYLKQSESGRVSVKFIIQPNGSTTDATIVETTFNNEHLEKCITAAPQYWHFPPPDGGGIVIVTYPFEISMPPEDGGAPSVSQAPDAAPAETKPAP